MGELHGKSWWENNYPLSPPLGYLLRRIYHPQWLRIHSLAESKRYAENDADYAELLRRHNKIGDDILGVGADCFLYESVYLQGNLTKDGWLVDLRQFQAAADSQILVSVTNVCWFATKFDDLLREVADNKTTPVVFASKVTGNIYAPYDGGADLIISDRTFRDRYKNDYSEWLSIREDGL